jgi:hypothetical protein
MNGRISSGVLSQTARLFRDLVIGIVCIYGGAPDPVLAQEIGRMLPDTASTGYSFPRVGNGYLWSFKSVSDNKEGFALEVSSLQGEQRIHVAFWLDGAQKIWIDDAVVLTNRRILIAGLESRPGEIAQLTRFLAIIGFDGKIERFIDTGTYEPERVCTDAKDHLWSFGQDKVAESQGVAYDALRLYSSSGKLIKSYIPNQDVASTAFDLGAHLDDARTVGRPATVFLSCSKSGVGIYVSATRSWIFLSAVEDTVQSWQGDLPGRPAGLTGLVLMDDGQVYASIRVFDKTSHAEVSRGLYNLHIEDKGFATWMPIEDTVTTVSAPFGFGKLLGSYQDNLIYLRNGADTSKPEQVCCTSQFYLTQPPIYSFVKR